MADIFSVNMLKNELSVDANGQPLCPAQKSLRYTCAFYSSHSCSKTIRLMLRYSNAGDVVCSPFGGVGTDLLASLLTARRCIIIEQDEVRAKEIMRRKKVLLRQHPDLVRFKQPTPADCINEDSPYFKFAPFRQLVVKDYRTPLTKAAVKQSEKASKAVGKEAEKTIVLSDSDDEDEDVEDVDDEHEEDEDDENDEDELHVDASADVVDDDDVDAAEEGKKKKRKTKTPSTQTKPKSPKQSQERTESEAVRTKKKQKVARPAVPESEEDDSRSVSATPLDQQRAKAATKHMSAAPDKAAKRQKVATKGDGGTGGRGRARHAVDDDVDTTSNSDMPAESQRGKLKANADTDFAGLAGKIAAARRRRR